MAFLVAYALIGFCVSSHNLWLYVKAFDDKEQNKHLGALLRAGRAKDAAEHVAWLDEVRSIEPWREVLNDAILGVIWFGPLWVNRKAYARLLVLKWQEFRR
jgi:hypothetical protein